VVTVVKINGIEYEIEKMPALFYGKNLKEDREIAQFTIINGRKLRYEPLKIVELENEQYIIENDAVTELRFDTFEHKISCIEPIAKFDKYIPASRSHQTRTGFAVTMRSVLEKYKRELSRFHYINIDYVEGTYLDVSITPKEYDGDTFYNIVADLFRTVDAIPKAYYENDTWFIYPQFLNERHNLISDDREGYYTTQNNIDYATKIRTSVKNGVFSNPSPLWFPSVDGFIQPRAEGTIISESRLRFELDSKNATLIKVLAISNVAIEGPSSVIVLENELIDITEHVVTQQEYDGLIRVSPFSVNYDRIKHKENCLILDLENNLITNLYQSEGGLLAFLRDVDIFRNALATVANNTYEDFVDIIDYDVKDARIRVQYQRLRDSDITLQRMASGLMNQSTMGYTQKSSIIDTQKYMNSLSILADRMGNQEKTIIKTFNTNEPRYQVGDYDSEGFVIIEAKYTKHTNSYFCEFKLAKNYANVNPDYALQYELTPYTVSAKKLTTNVIDEQFVIASEVQLANDTKMTLRGINSLFSIFSKANNQRMEYAVYKHIWQLHPYSQFIHMPVEAQVGGNTIAFNARFLKQIVAGTRKEQDGSSTFLQPILYTADINQDFILEDFDLYLTNGGVVTDNGSYPIVNETPTIISNALTINERMPIDLGINDAFAYTFAIHAITANEDKVGFGNGFAKYNGLWQETIPNLTLYKSPYPYSVADKKIRAVDTVVSNGAYSFNNAQRRLTVNGTETFNYWALAYEGDIVIWGNGIKTIYFSIVRELEPDFDPITIISDSKTLQISITLTHTAIIQNYTLIQESYNESIPITLTYQATIGDYTIINRVYEDTIPIVLTSQATITNYDNLTFSEQLNVPIVLTHQATITSYSDITDNVSLNIPIVLTVNQSIQNVEYEFSYAGTTTQSFDDSKNLIVEGIDSAACPTTQFVINWFNANFDPMTYNLGDVIRVQVFVVDNEFPVAQCTTHYFEVVLSG
jgi:hypothetical protein